MGNLDLRLGLHQTLPSVGFALLLSACGIGNGIADFGSDMTNPQIVTIGDSRRVAQGHFSSPIVDPWDDRGPIIIAFEYLGNDPHLAMRPVDGTPGCDTSIAYSSVVRDKLNNRAQLVAYQGSADMYGRGDTHFVDHNCNEYGPQVPHCKLPDMLYNDPPGYLVNSATYTYDSNNVPSVASTQLLVVDPWNGTSTVLVKNLSWWTILSSDQQTIAVIDSGHYKIINGKREVTSDIGTAVTEITFLSGQDGSFALVDGGALRIYQSLTDTAPIEVAKDACQPALDGGGCLFYYSPCASRQLQCYRADTGTTFPIDTGVSSTVASHATSGTSDLTVIYTKPNAANGADLWSFSWGAAPVMIVPNFRSLYGWNPPPNLEIDALVNGDDNTAQAIRHTAAGDTLLVDAVSVKFSQGLLANFDVTKSNGDLYTPIQLGQTPQFIIGGVPSYDRRASIFTSKNTGTIPYGTAVITDATGDMGNLTLLRYPSPSSPGPDLPRTIAANVPVNGCKFFDNMNAIAYTQDYVDAKGVGTFVVHQLDLDARTTVSGEVSEFQEVKWPAEGVMYIIPSGDRQGIWVAKAK
jgi:hypothetical protein